MVEVYVQIILFCLGIGALGWMSAVSYRTAKEFKRGMAAHVLHQDIEALILALVKDNLITVHELFTVKVAFEKGHMRLAYDRADTITRQLLAAARNRCRQEKERP